MIKHFKIIIFLTLFFNHIILKAGEWIQKDSLWFAKYGAVGFSISHFGYIVGGGNNVTTYNDLWEWDQNSNTWSQKMNLPIGYIASAVGFSIDLKGYIGTGSTDSLFYDSQFWEWDQVTNTWTQKANFLGSGRYGATGFSIGTKGYIGLGNDGQVGDPLRNDFWEWDQATDTWTEKALYPGTARVSDVGFSIGTTGYIDGHQEMWAWDQASNTWLQKTGMPVKEGFAAAGFVIGAKAYIGTGDTIGGDMGIAALFWEYNSVTDSWTKKPDFLGGPRVNAVGFSIGNRGYIGTGSDGSNLYNDLWEYCDTCSVGINELDKTNTFTVFPNPSNGIFTIQFLNYTEGDIRIYDLQGRLINQTSFRNKILKLDISNQPEGIYIVEWHSTKGTVIKKILKF